MKFLIVAFLSFSLLSCLKSENLSILGVMPEIPVLIDAPLTRCELQVVDGEGERVCIQIPSPWIKLRFYFHNKNTEESVTVVALRAEDIGSDQVYEIDFLSETQIGYTSENASDVEVSSESVNCSVEERNVVRSNLENGFIFEIPPGECRHFQFSIFLSVSLDDESENDTVRYIRNLNFEAIGWVGTSDEPTARLKTETRIKTQ